MPGRGQTLRLLWCWIQYRAEGLEGDKRGGGLKERVQETSVWYHVGEAPGWGGTGLSFHRCSQDQTPIRQLGPCTNHLEGRGGGGCRLRQHRALRDRGQALVSLGYRLLLLTFRPNREPAEKQGQQFQQLSSETTLFFSLPSSHWVNSHTHTQHMCQAAWISPLSPSLVFDDSRLQPFHCHSRPSPGSQWLEKRSQVYSMSTYTFLPQGFTNGQGSPQPPAPPHLLLPGRLTRRVGRDGLQRGMRDEETPRPRRMASFSGCDETKPP